MPQYLCLVTVLSNVDSPIPNPNPPGIWGPTDPRPTPPIAQPPGGWGGRPRPPGVPTHPIYNPPYPDQGLPGNQPYPDQGLPGNQPYPDQGLPGQQPRPDQGLPPFPSHPIFIPPAGGQPPLGIWGPTDPRPGYGLPGPQPRPEHPIVLPPDLPPTTPEGGPIDWKVAWTPVTGWIVVGIPAEGTLVPTPSK
jgi:hypothetical protein